MIGLKFKDVFLNLLESLFKSWFRLTTLVPKIEDGFNDGEEGDYGDNLTDERGKAPSDFSEHV